MNGIKNSNPHHPQYSKHIFVHELVCDFMSKNCVSWSGNSPEENEDLSTFILGSWQTFLVVLSKEQPLTLSPNICHLITMAFIKAIRARLGDEKLNMKIITSLSETCLVLLQRWLTKCAGDSMSAFVHEVGLLLDDFSSCFDILHPRSRVAVLGKQNIFL